MIERLKQKFMEIYGESENEIYIYFSPGRVNLIGEHIDYNGGYVFPCALDMGTYMAVRIRGDQSVYFSSMNLPQRTVISLDEEISFEKSHDWANYPKGVLSLLKSEDIQLKGMDILYNGNIPNGSGLSSSASLEVVTAYGVNDLMEGGLSLKNLVLLSQRAEREFIKVNCGIMDQFAVGYGKKNSAILLKCDSLEYEYAPLELTTHRIVICNSNKKRGLADSKYNERRAECESALKSLKLAADIQNLCDLTPEAYEVHKHMIKEPISQKRAEHAVYENERTKEAVKVLNNGDLTAFGKLMNASHNSLRDLYEVSCYELDVLVEEALRVEGTLGARMTGAGFGGCTVNIVEKDKVEQFITLVSEHYEQRTGLKADIYIANPGDGVRKL